MKRLSKEEYDEMHSWLEKYMEKPHDHHRDLAKDRYKVQCHVCEHKFTLTIPENRYLMSFDVQCPKCENTYKDIHLTHFYKN